MNLARAAVWTGLLGLAGACYLTDPGPGGRERDLEDARERWEEVGPSSYRTVVSRLCFCPSTGPVVVTVRPSGVTRVYQETPAAAVPPQDLEAYPTVEEAFAIVQEAFDQRADRVDVRYDSVTGAPLEIYIDRVEEAVDEEVRYELSAPEPLPAG